MKSKNTAKKNSTPSTNVSAWKKHLSPRLRADARANVAPRHVATVSKKADEAVLVKIYAPLTTPGSELMTVCAVWASEKVEVEMAFDERFPVSIQFRKESDEQRVEYAKKQIQTAGGFEAVLAELKKLG